MASIPLFLHILSSFLPSLYVFSHFCLVSAIYLPIFLPFLPVFESSFSNFCPMLRLAEQCDTKEWYISLAEQNWRIWPPLRGYFLAEQDWVLAERNCWPPLKNAPRTPMYTNSFSVSKSPTQCFHTIYFRHCQRWAFHCLSTLQRSSLMDSFHNLSLIEDLCSDVVNWRTLPSTSTSTS